MGAFKIFNETTQQWEYATVVSETNSSLVIGAALGGAVDGTNDTFTSPVDFWNIAVYKNGVRMREGSDNDYIITGTSIIFNTPPTIGTVLTADITTRPQQMIDTFQGVIDTIYPIGSIYMNDSVATNPATLLNMPWSTWVAITDKMIMAKGSTYTTDGGSATHTHNIPLQNGYDSNRALPYEADDFQAIVTEMGATIYSKAISARGRTGFTTATAGANIEVWRMTTPAASNLPPYTTAYMWRRTA